MNEQRSEDLQLTREIPARTETVKFLWVQRDFMKFGPFNAARERMKIKVYSHCWWCRKPFSDEDTMALAGVNGGSNKLLCQGCADDAGVPK